MTAVLRGAARPKWQGDGNSRPPSLVLFHHYKDLSEPLPQSPPIKAASGLPSGTTAAVKADPTKSAILTTSRWDLEGGHSCWHILSGRICNYVKGPKSQEDTAPDVALLPAHYLCPRMRSHRLHSYQVRSAWFSHKGLTHICLFTGLHCQQQISWEGCGHITKPVSICPVDREISQAYPILGFWKSVGISLEGNHWPSGKKNTNACTSGSKTLILPFKKTKSLLPLSPHPFLSSHLPSHLGGRLQTCPELFDPADLQVGYGGAAGVQALKSLSVLVTSVFQRFLLWNEDNTHLMGARGRITKNNAPQSAKNSRKCTAALKCSWLLFSSRAGMHWLR